MPGSRGIILRGCGGKCWSLWERARRIDNRKAVERNGRKRWIWGPRGSKSCFPLRLSSTALLIRSFLGLSYAFVVVAVVGRVLYINHFQTFVRGIGD